MDKSKISQSYGHVDNGEKPGKGLYCLDECYTFRESLSTTLSFCSRYNK